MNRKLLPDSNAIALPFEANSWHVPGIEGILEG
jgi:hypothetical protein